MARFLIHLFALIILGLAITQVVRFILLNDVNLIQIQVVDFEWVNALYISLGCIASAFIVFVFFISVNPANKIWMYVVYPLIMIALSAFVFYQIPFVAPSL